MKEGPSSSLQDSMDPVLLTAVIDNQKISNLTQQRVETPVIALTLPRDNLAGIAAGTYSPQVGNGYHLAPAPSISEAKPRLVFLPALLSRSPI